MALAGGFFGGARGGEDVTEGEGEVFREGLLDGCGGDVMLFVVGLLKDAAVLGDAEGFLDGLGLLVGVHDDTPLSVAGGSTAGLDEGGFGAEEAFLVSIEDGDEGDLGDV